MKGAESFILCVKWLGNRSFTSAPVRQPAPLMFAWMNRLECWWPSRACRAGVGIKTVWGTWSAYPTLQNRVVLWEPISPHSCGNLTLKYSVFPISYSGVWRLIWRLWWPGRTPKAHLMIVNPWLNERCIVYTLCWVAGQQKRYFGPS